MKSKWLYFLWDAEATSEEPKLCGCVGGCYFYSVFNEQESILKHTFFNMNTSITRMNSNYADSLFYPGTHILNSQDMMKNKYVYEFYTHKFAEYELQNQKKSLEQYRKEEVFVFESDKKDKTPADNSLLSSYSSRNSVISSLSSSSSSSSIVSVISKNESVKIRSNSSLNDDKFATLKPNQNNSSL
jgi:hypothetical protein